MLEELQVPYEIKYYQRTSQQLAPKELREVHPLGKSPILTDTDRNEVIAESGAIIDYVLKYYGKGQGLPKKDQEDADNFWKQFAEASFMTTVTLELVTTLVPRQSPFYIRPLMNVIMGQLRQRFSGPDMERKIAFSADALEKQSKDGRAWIVGGDSNGGPTAADYQMLFPFEALTGGLKDNYTIPESIQNWVDWVHARPAYQRALEKGGPYDLNF
ncbi:glutathione transferase [Malassezia psittaci]|uniref:Glutathione transferase n=1 Tax=Malassezia psittaci TaxID=1821823 RepID=A0AAF0FAB2_9BASI|nr:glutathione transferase [Malassezia psittaci]